MRRHRPRSTCRVKPAVFATTFRCVGRRVDLDDLLDAGEVAELLGLASANVVNVNEGRVAR